MFVAARQLAQLRPSDTNNALALAGAGQAIELSRIVIANTTGTAATFRLFHDDAATTFDASTALYYDVSVPANSSTVIEANAPGTGIVVAAGGEIQVRSGTADALTFTLYGVAARTGYY